MPSSNTHESARNWGTRIQLIWILFAAVYSALGTYLPQLAEILRHPSGASLFVPGAWLVCGTLGKQIIVFDSDRAQQDLLVPFAALLFLTSQSFKLSEPDVVGVVVGLVLATPLFVAAWEAGSLNGSNSRSRCSTLFLVSLCAVIATTVCMPVNLLFYYFGQFNPRFSGHLVIGAPSIGLFGGLMIGVVARKAAFTDASFRKQASPDERNYRHIFTIAVFVIVHAVLVSILATSDLKRDWGLESTVLSHTLTTLIAVTMTLLLYFCICKVVLLSSPRVRGANRRHFLLKLLTRGLVAGVSQGLIVVLLRSQIGTTAFIPMATILEEAVVGLLVAVAVGLAFLVADRVQKWALLADAR